MKSVSDNMIFSLSMKSSWYYNYEDMIIENSYDYDYSQKKVITIIITIAEA